MMSEFWLNRMTSRIVRSATDGRRSIGNSNRANPPIREGGRRAQDNPHDVRRSHEQTCNGAGQEGEDFSPPVEVMVNKAVAGDPKAFATVAQFADKFEEFKPADGKSSRCS